MAWGPAYVDQPTSWGQQLLALAESVSDIRREKKEDDERKQIAASRAEQVEASKQERLMRQRKMDEEAAFQSDVSSLPSTMPSPEAQKEAARGSLYENWDQVMALPDTASRRAAGQAAEQAGAASVKPDDVGAFRTATEKLGKYGSLATPFLGAKKDLAEMQAKAKKSSQNIFEELSLNDQKQIYAIAERRAKGIDKPNKYIEDFPAFGKNGSIRALVDNLTYEINPDFNSYEAELKWGAQSAETKKEATLTPRIISKEAGRESTLGAAGVIGKATGETASNISSLPGFKPISGARITDESVQKIKTISPDIEAMKILADGLIEKYNTMGMKFTGDDAADYASKVRNLQLLAKSPSLYNLGVLTGPDLMLLEQTIPNPSSIKEGVKKQVIGDLSVKLKNFRDLMELRGNQFYRINGFEKEKEESKINLTGDKARRLEELRRKAAQGTLK